MRAPQSKALARVVERRTGRSLWSARPQGRVSSCSSDFQALWRFGLHAEKIEFWPVNRLNPRTTRRESGRGLPQSKTLARVVVRRTGRSLRVALATIISIACTLFCAAGPANDNFAARITLTGTNLTLTGSNSGASKEAGEPDHADNPGGKSVWWRWTAPTNGDLTITTDGSEFDTLLAVYRGSSLAALSRVATNDDHGILFTSRVRFQAVQGIEYQIAVDGYNDTTNVESGAITLKLVFVSEPILRPPNDNFANSISFTGTSMTATGSNVEATRETGEPLHALKAGDTSVWWSWTAPVGGGVIVSTEGSTFDTLLAVYRGSALTNLVEAAIDDDQDPAAGILTSALGFYAAAGETYRIAVDGFDGASGQVSLHVEMVNVSLSGARRLPDGTFQFTLEGPKGRSFQIIAATGLTGWTAIATLVNTNGTVIVADPAAATFDQRFYRALLKL